MIRPVDWPAIRVAIWKWFQYHSSLEVIWGNQAAPQPAYPYASITITGGSPNDMGVHAHEGWLADGGLQLTEQREFTLSCQIHAGPPTEGEPECDPMVIMDGILASLSTPTVIEDLRQSGLALRDKGQPQTIDLVVGSDWIRRQQVDLRFGFAAVTNERSGMEGVGYFEKVEISSTISGIKNPGGSLELDKEILDPNA